MGTALAWAAALGSIPIILHVLHRRRFQETEWAAMRFLLEATRKKSRRLRFERLLLLAVRTMVMVLIAIALMGQLGGNGATTGGGPGATHYIVVLDSSLSMGTRVDDGTRFTAAQGVARRIVREANSGDALHLVRIADVSPTLVFRQPAFQARHVLRELEQLEVTDEVGEVIPAMEAVEDLLTKLPEMTRKQVVVISDFQQENWQPEENGGQPRLQELMRAIAAKSRLMMLDVGRYEAANVAVTQLSSDQPFCAIDTPITITATVKNFGSNAVGELPVELWLGKRLLERKRVKLEAGSEATANFTHSFGESGDQKLEARIPNDTLSADDRRWLSLPVREHFSILPVDGGIDHPLEATASLYLQVALSPSVRDSPWTGSLKPVEPISDVRFGDRIFDQSDCIILAEPGSLSDAAVRRLEQYVRGGGGVIMCVGDDIDDMEQLNRLAFRNGQGFMAARLDDVVESEEPLVFDVSKLNHPVLEPFRGNPGAGLETSFTGKHVRVTLPDDGSASTILKYSNQDAAIVERRFGNGRSVLITTSLDMSWSTWPVSPSFPPVINELVRSTVAGRWTRPILLVGDQFGRILTERDANSTAALQLPNGKERPLAIRKSEEDVVVETEPLMKRGMYTLTLDGKTDAAQSVAVNPNTRESPVARLTQPDLEEQLNGIGFDYRTDWQSSGGGGEAAPSTGEDLVRVILYAVLALLLVESIVAWNATIGAYVLIGIVAAEFLRRLVVWIF